MRPATETLNEGRDMFTPFNRRSFKSRQLPKLRSGRVHNIEGGPGRSSHYPLLLTAIEDDGDNDCEIHNRWKPIHSNCLNPRRSRHCTLTALRARPLKPHSCSPTSCPGIFLCSHRHVHNMRSTQVERILPHAMLYLPWTKWE